MSIVFKEDPKKGRIHLTTELTEELISIGVPVTCRCKLDIILDIPDPNGSKIDVACKSYSIHDVTCRHCALKNGKKGKINYRVDPGE